MKYNFDYNIDLKGTLTISIYKLGFIFNKETIARFGHPKKINIGIDRENKALGIKAANINDTSIKSFQFSKTGKEKYLRIVSTPIVREIEKMTGMKFSDKLVRFKAQYDYYNGIIIVEF